MTVYSNDPIRIKITLADLMNLTHSKGIDSCAYPTTDQPKDEFYIKFACSDINPFCPKEERYREDIEKEIAKLKVVQDRIKEFECHRHFNPCQSIVKESILDEKIFCKDNRYDTLLDKVKDVHRLKDGRLFGTIEQG